MKFGTKVRSSFEKTKRAERQRSECGRNMEGERSARGARWFVKFFGKPPEVILSQRER